MIIVSSIFLICMTIFETFRRKYKKDIFLGYLKSSDTTSIADDVIIKLFDLGDE